MRFRPCTAATPSTAACPTATRFGGTVIERHENRAIVEVNQKRYHLHKGQGHEANFDVTVELPHEFWVID